jgi:hypothetical protein
MRLMSDLSPVLPAVPGHIPPARTHAEAPEYSRHVLCACDPCRASSLPVQMLKETLDKMSEKIEITNQGWEAGTGDSIARRLEEHKMGVSVDPH